MRHPRTILAAFAAALLLSACASAPATGSRARVDMTLITREQIQELQSTTAYDAIKALRGTWLNVHGPESFRYPQAVQVYLDGTHMGDASVLASIGTPPIQFIRYYNGQEATARWGIDHGAGAIYISTKVGIKGVPTPPNSPR